MAGGRCQLLWIPFLNLVRELQASDLSAQGAAGLRIARDAVDPGATWHEVDRERGGHPALFSFGCGTSQRRPSAAAYMEEVD